MSSSVPAARRCKIVVIGDASVGKTCLLHAYAHPGEFLSEHVPTVFNNFETSLQMQNGTAAPESVTVSLWDTAGQEEYQQLRQMCYGGNRTATPAGAGTSAGGEGPSTTTAGDDVSVFLLCFAWNNPQSFTNIELKWYRELRQVAEDAAARTGHSGDLRSVQRPFSLVLVGTKADLRPAAGERGSLTAADAEALRRKVGAHSLVECSAKSGNGVRDVFETAMLSWFEREETARLEAAAAAASKRVCTLL